jgi:electron transport complex protein RnfB
VIDETLCIGCRKCIDACPVDAIVGAPKLMRTVIARECTGCELCLPPCPVDCIAMLPAAPMQPGETWPEYPLAETARWRRRTEQRLERLAQTRRARRKKPAGHAVNAAATTPLLPHDREKIRAEIRAAVDRVRARKKTARD